MKTIQKNLTELVLTINNGYILKNVEVFVSKSNIILVFLKILKKNGFILGYTIINNSIKIFLKKGLKGFVYNIKLFFKKGISYTFSYSQLLLLKKKMRSPTFLLFATTEGFLSFEEILRKKIGGKLILRICEN